MAHEKREQVITYYQWIPVILIMQGTLFYLPSLIWRINSGKSGLNINKISVLLSGTIITMLYVICTPLCALLSDYQCDKN